MVLKFILPHCLQTFPQIDLSSLNETKNIGKIIIDVWKKIDWKNNSYLGEFSTKQVRADGSGVKRDSLAPTELVYHFLYFSILKNSLPKNAKLGTNINFQCNYYIFF